MDSKKTQKSRRRMNATVVSNKMEKTAVVRVDRTIVHPKYGKRYTVSKRLKAHDPENKAVMDEKVIIEGMRPLSKDKRWRIVYATK